MSRQLCPPEPRRDVVGHDLGRVGKALGVREFLAIIHDVDAEPDFVRHGGEMEPHVSGADDVKFG